MVMEVVKALRPGTLFYETFGDGDCDEFVCLTAPALTDGGMWEWEARRSCGPPPAEIITFAVREGWDFYVPQLTLTPTVEIK